jgi:hypothetical protein
MGRLGVRMLVERAKYPNQPQTTSSLATHLVERQSVAAWQGSRVSSKAKVGLEPKREVTVGNTS